MGLVFLDAVAHTARDGIAVTNQLLAYDATARAKLTALGRRATTGLALLARLYDRPVVSTRDIQQQVPCSPQVSQALVREFVTLGILREITGNKRNRLFCL